MAFFLFHTKCSNIYNIIYFYGVKIKKYRLDKVLAGTCKFMHVVVVVVYGEVRCIYYNEICVWKRYTARVQRKKRRKRSIDRSIDESNKRKKKERTNKQMKGTKKEVIMN